MGKGNIISYIICFVLKLTAYMHFTQPLIVLFNEQYLSAKPSLMQLFPGWYSGVLWWGWWVVGPPHCFLSKVDNLILPSLCCGWVWYTAIISRAQQIGGQLHTNCRRVKTVWVCGFGLLTPGSMYIPSVEMGKYDEWGSPSEADESTSKSKVAQGMSQRQTPSKSQLLRGKSKSELTKCASHDQIPRWNSNSNLSREESRDQITRGFSQSKLTRGTSQSQLTRGTCQTQLSRGKSQHQLTRGCSQTHLTRGRSQNQLNRGISQYQLARGSSQNQLTIEKSQSVLNRQTSQSQLGREKPGKYEPLLTRCTSLGEQSRDKLNYGGYIEQAPSR